LLDGCSACGGVNASGSATVTVVPSSSLLCQRSSRHCASWTRPFTNRQAEAGAFVLALIGLAGLEERIADPLEIVGGDADPGIGDAAASAAILDHGRDRHAAAALGELDGVDDEVERDLL